MDVQRVDMAVSAVHTRMTQRWRSASEREELLSTRWAFLLSESTREIEEVFDDVDELGVWK